MKRLNQIGLETRFGYRTVDLFHGDLTDRSVSADLLVVSAFGRSYGPTPGTLIEALSRNCGISVKASASDPDYDFRLPLGFWISKPLVSPQFNRLLVVELIGGSQPIPSAIENIFVGLSILEAKGVEVRSVAMAIPGGGSQQLRNDEVMPSLLRGAKDALNRSLYLSRISFIEKDEGRVLSLDSELNSALGRVAVKLPKTELIENLKADLRTSLTRLEAIIPAAHQNLVVELRTTLQNNAVRSFEIGILGRRVAELVVDTLLALPKTSPDLMKKIERLSERGVAQWIQGYLHTLRILGNESAHEKPTDARIPRIVAEDDLALCLFCIQRVLAFFESYLEAGKGKYQE